MSAGKETGVLLVRNGRYSACQGEGLHEAVFPVCDKERTVSPILLILVVILILSLLGGGYGFRSGNTVLGAGGGLVGLILIILLILALLGRLPL